MTVIAGPALCFKGSKPDVWHVSALVVTADTEVAPAFEIVDMTVDDILEQPTVLMKHGTARVWRVNMFLEQLPAPRTVEYRVETNAYQLHIPASGAGPRMAYGSCNGFSDSRYAKKYDLTGDSGLPNAFANWEAMCKKHAEQPYNLILQGGDQIYADAIRYEWGKLQDKYGWTTEQLHQQDGTEVTRLLDKFFWDTYIKQWKQKDIATLYAAVPAVMMWDDHDIIDGWGSHTNSRESSPLYKKLFETANRYFSIFQRHLRPDETSEATHYLAEIGHSAGFVIGNCGLMVLDLRTERTPECIMSPASWNSVYAWLDNHRHVDHLFVMSSIPVLHPNFQLLENALGIIPGTQEIEDDLRDHWTSLAHADERVRLIKRLLHYADTRETRVTIVSGDVHVAAQGLIESTKYGKRRNQDAIYQLTSSGVVHPPPPGIVMFGLNQLLQADQQIDNWIIGRMLTFGNTTSRFIGARNWLSLEPNPPSNKRNPKDVYAKWYIEGLDQPYGRVIEGADPEK